jgi:hypothetical protein
MISKYFNYFFICFALFLFGACNSATDSGEYFVSGYAVDGSLAGARVEISSGSDVIAEAITARDGSFSMPVSYPPPYQMKVSGGMVGGEEYKGVLEAWCEELECYVTPWSSVIIRLIEMRDDLDPDQARELIKQSAGFDFDPFMHKLLTGEEVSESLFQISEVQDTLANGLGLENWVSEYAKRLLSYGCLFPDNLRQQYGVSCSELPVEGVRVDNAGIVLASSFIQSLFERLGLLDNKNQFVDHESNKRAVRVLDYLGTGASKYDQSYLILNKILSGLEVDEDSGRDIELSAAEKDQITSLISAIIRYWSAIGFSSVNGFRESWFIRSGVLYETTDSWELVVERRAYDVLLTKIPFAFSTVKYPWMKKPLYVRWL